MKKIYITILLSLTTLSVYATNNKVEPMEAGCAVQKEESVGAGEKRKMTYRGFIGGMMLHTGYVQSDAVSISSPAGSQTVTAKGAPFGMGGAIRFIFGKHLRVGSEGYVSTLTYGENKSKSKIGWGGLLADCVWRFGNWRLFAGGTVGGGAATNTVLISPVSQDYIAEDFVSYRKYGFFCLTPFFGTEYRITKKVNLVVKADYLINLTNHQADFVSGPRLYFGIMFGHSD